MDVFNMDCVPQGMDRATAVSQVRQEISDIEFLEDPVITEENLASDDNRTPEQQLQNLRNAYNGLKIAVYVTGIASLLLIAGAILLAPRYRTGLRRASVVAIVVGSVSALVAWIGAFLTERLSASFAEGEIQATLTDVISLLTADVRNWWLGYGTLLILLGIAVLVVLHFIKPPQESEASAEHEKVEDAPAGKPEKEQKSTDSSTGTKK